MVIKSRKTFTMDYMQIMISFIGGLALFIYGMQEMANGLQKSAGTRMKKLLEVLTNNRFLGVLVGAFVTSIIQSSSATTVMVIGFVNAGLMSLTQSVGVIMGANIGTTITSWLVSSVEWAEYLNPVKLAPIAVAIGVMLMFIKKDMVKKIAEMILGFGLLFMGLNLMSTGVAPLRESPFFRELFLNLGSNPILGVLAGTAVTGIIQSSSASVGILQSIAAVGLVPWNAAVYIIMGQNIGTCVTALLSSIGASKNAKSAAYIHLLFNVTGSIIFTIVSVIFFKYINPAFGNGLISQTEISVVHTTFNFANTLLLFPFPGFLIYFATKMTKGYDNEDEMPLAHIDDRILETPSIAVSSVEKEVVRMGYFVLDSLKFVLEALIDRNTDKIEKALKREENIDTSAHAITQFLVKLCNTTINKEEYNIVTSLFHTVNDIERVGDHCVNIAELAQFTVEEHLFFSEIAENELKEIIAITIDSFKTAITALETTDKKLATKAILLENQIDVLEKKFRSGHIQRLTASLCNPAVGVVFLDTLTNLERISDHSKNVAEAVDIRLKRKIIITKR